MSHVILGGHGQGVSPKPFAIVPVPNLVRCTQSERTYYDCGRCAKASPMVAPESGKIDNSPGGREAEPDLRTISITIAMSFSADPHQSDYSYKHNQVPTPT